MYPDAFLNHAHLSVDNSRISPDVTLLSVGAHLARTLLSPTGHRPRGASLLDLQHRVSTPSTGEQPTLFVLTSYGRHTHKISQSTNCSVRRSKFSESSSQ